MKNILSRNKTLVVLLVVTALFLGFYVYMLARPISYGMNYHNEIVYEGVEFEGDLKFRPNGKVLVKNSNFDEEFESYYYYKRGYIFSLMAENDEEYKAELEYINDNFEAVTESPFYAAKINAFKQYSEGLDSEVTTYTCIGAIVFAIVGGVILLALAALSATSFILFKKGKKAE